MWNTTKWRMQRRWVALLLAAAMLAFGGCRRGDQPALGSVVGVVSLDGEPLPGAFVQFDPGTARSSVGETDENGRYELTYLRDMKGAVVGYHTVRITTQTETRPEILHPNYHSETILSANVQPGHNEIDFPLTSL